ncbi:diguanylate cyclase (GGDEF) domain protein [compost metagenome]
MVLLENLHSPEYATAVAEKIRITVNQPFDLAGHHVLILPSIGVALYPQHGDEESQLLKHADKAMYYAKRSGGNRIHMLAGANPVEVDNQPQPIQ